MLGLASILNPMKHRGCCQTNNVMDTNRCTVRYHNTIPNRLIVPLLVDSLLKGERQGLISLIYLNTKTLPTLDPTLMLRTT